MISVFGQRPIPYLKYEPLTKVIHYMRVAAEDSRRSNTWNCLRHGMLYHYSHIHSLSKLSELPYKQ